MSELDKLLMKTVQISILTLLLLSLPIVISAQVTAVMQAKVTIISGAGLITDQNPSLDLSASSLNLNNEVGTRSFSLNTVPGADLQIRISDQPVIKSDSGEQFLFDDLSIQHESDATGKHTFSVQGKLGQVSASNANYEGTITAVVEYL